MWELTSSFQVSPLCEWHLFARIPFAKPQKKNRKIFLKIVISKTTETVARVRSLNPHRRSDSGVVSRSAELYCSTYERDSPHSHILQQEKLIDLKMGIPFSYGTHQQVSCYSDVFTDKFEWIRRFRPVLLKITRTSARPLLTRMQDWFHTAIKGWLYFSFNRLKTSAYRLIETSRRDLLPGSTAPFGLAFSAQQISLRSRSFFSHSSDADSWTSSDVANTANLSVLMHVSVKSRSDGRTSHDIR